MGVLRAGHHVMDRVVAASIGDDAMMWLRIFVVVVVAFAASRVVPRLARRVVRRLLDARLRQRFAILRQHAPRALMASGPTPTVRYEQRAEALGTLTKHLTAGLIWLVAVVVCLHGLHVALATVVTGAGFLGVAISLGAQDLLRDYIAGFFMLLDDRFGVGDRIEAGELVGDIEEMTLRWTRIRDANGTEWYVPNARLQEIGNRSQHRGKAIIDVDLPAGLRLDDALERIDKSMRGLCDDPKVGTFVLEHPQILGVERLDRAGPTIRLAVHTTAAKQADVARVVRARVHAALAPPEDRLGGGDAST
jgi:moderate conductance mechanosensitive channel